MNRRLPFGQLRRLRRDLAKENARWPVVMTPVEQAQWPAEVIQIRLATPVAVWRSRYFLAVLYAEPEKAIPRLSVCLTALNDEGQFADGLTWEDLQRVKSECGFGSKDAVEVFPRDRDVVNVANLRHLWILDAPSELVWRADDVAAAVRLRKVEPGPAAESLNAID